MYSYSTLKDGLSYALKCLYTIKYQALILIIFAIFQGVSPALTIFTTQLLIDSFLLSTTPLDRTFLAIFSIWLLSVSMGTFLNPWATLLHANISEIMSEKLQVALMSLITNQNDQMAMEEPETINDVHFVKSQIEFRPLNFIMMLANTLKDSITITGIVIVLININIISPAILLVTLIPHAYLSVKTKEREWLTKRAHGLNLKIMYHLFNHALDNNTHMERRILRANGFIIKRHQDVFLEMHRKLKKIRIKAALFPMVSLSIALMGVITTFFLVIFQSGTQISPGNIAAILFSFIMLQQTAESTIRDQIDFTQTLNYFSIFKKLSTKLATPSENLEPSNKLPINSIEKVEFRNVSFTYPDGTTALECVSFTAYKGEKIAIVGKNGSGKTTLIKLLLGSYKPRSGLILINDIPITEEWARNNHKVITCLTQDYGKYIFSAEENIGFGKYVPEQIKHRLPFIDDWKKPLCPTLGGYNLSGGQWQQLALQRAMLSVKSMCVFDEPTSSIDPILESRIIENLVTAPSDLTFIVTHRLGAVSRTHKILLLDSGKIIIQGSHDKLINSSNEYRKFYLSQANMYKEDTTV